MTKCFSNAEIKELPTPNVYLLKLSFRNKGEMRHSQMKKNKENLFLADLP